MYIYHLPHKERRELCRILDQNNKWEELGASHMKYDALTIQDLRREIYRGNSPTEELLMLWGHQNHTVLELFILLSRMKHYQGMTMIKQFIDPKYHPLIRQTDVLTTELSGAESKNVNLNSANEKILNVKSIPQSVVAAGTSRNPSRQPAEPTRKPYGTKPLIVINLNGVSEENNESVAPIVKMIAGPRSPTPLADAIERVPSGQAAISCVVQSAGSIPHISYDELRESTNNWDPKGLLGKGGFGTVFKGTWKHTKVAIKRIELRADNPDAHREQINQSIRELHCLNMYRHDNILPVYAYSAGGPQQCLIYQYMSGGSLFDRLRIQDQTKILKWQSRLNIATGTARGLQYLHCIGDTPLIHGDIKSANILLDSNDVPRIGDFGLAKEGPQVNYTHIIVHRIHGTRPYLPDEFLRAHKFSTKVDTYSFGIVLFEVATSLLPYSERRPDKFLKDHVAQHDDDILTLMDRRAGDREDIYKELIRIGNWCVTKRPKDRPEMVKVFEALEGVDSET